MELIEILAILILITMIGAIILLVALLLRKPSTFDPTNFVDTTVRSITEVLRREVTDPIIKEERSEQSAFRTEMQTELRGSRKETTETIQSSIEKLGNSLRESQRDTAELHAKSITDLNASEQKLMSELSTAQTNRFEAQDTRIDNMQKSLNALLSERMDNLNTTMIQRLTDVEKQFLNFQNQSNAAQELLRNTMENRMTSMQESNDKKLELMRETVDEKLQKTLDERISQSFKTVSDRLADVYKGLGEMQTLAGDVGDLKKVMAGVKTRGILGEIQLGAIISEILSPEQYIENTVTRPNTANRVEFAIKLPGDGDVPVLLPIDAKFPADTYHHLVDAYENGDTESIKIASAELETRIKGAAKDIRDKYIEPPYTTTFGIMFLPFEGLYAEVVRMGLVDTLQTQYHVSVAGPTTLAALLNSLQMGFRTLAIQKRSGEVWEVLGAVKTEFGNFEKVLSKAKERIDQTGDELDKLIGVRTRQINRKLKSVSELPAIDAEKLLDGVLVDDEP